MASPDLIACLALLEAPVDREGFIRRAAIEGVGPEAAGRLWDRLQADGWLTAVSETSQPLALAQAFSGWRSQRGLLSDMLRTQAFERAIEAVVDRGTSAVDVGCGSGILSFFAARAGAQKVFALESTSIIDDARELALANGLADRVSFVRGDAAAFRVPQPVDLVMGEWAGMWLLEEWRHFDAFARVRDACLKAGGRVMPTRATMHLSPVDDSGLYVERGPGFWQRPVWGFDFGLVHERQLDRTRRIIVQADRRTLLHPVEVLAVDCAKDDSRAFFFEREFSVEFAHAASCHGFVGWFTLELAPGIVLDTSPMSIDTHWHQSYLPIEMLQIEPGDVLLTRLRSVPDELTGSPVLDLRVELLRQGACATARQHRYTLDDTQG